MTLQQLKYVIAIADSGSLSEAAKRLYLSQPSLSSALTELESEIGVELFSRSNRGVRITPEGEDFLGYARQVTDQYSLLEDRYIHRARKQRFSVSAQHYTFAVQAFSQLMHEAGTDEYEFAFYETRTGDVIKNVHSFKSELGVLYLDSFNEKILQKLLRENSLEFCELFPCKTYVYLSSSHPLANQKEITMEQLQDYPCLSFEQGSENSFYLAEESLNTYSHKRLIKISDRATALNLMVALPAFTVCSGIICEELNGSGYRAILLKGGSEMRIGYIYRSGSRKSALAQTYIQHLVEYQKYQNSGVF